MLIAVLTLGLVVGANALWKLQESRYWRWVGIVLEKD